MKIKNLLPAFLLLCSFGAFAQTNKYTKLEIKHNEVFEVGPTNMVLADTLIMHDKSTIKFSPETAGILQANYAIVGDKCEITSRGSKGINSDSRALGTPGQNGGNLDIILHFDKLGSLTIDTRGGRGGNGGKIVDATGKIITLKEVKLSDGRTAKEVIPTPTGLGIPQTGYSGTDVTTGFNGGNGGSINFTYSAKNFFPLFKNAIGKHKIKLLHNAGLQGKNGTPHRDGKLVQINDNEPTDGQVNLINVNSKSEQE